LIESGQFLSLVQMLTSIAHHQAHGQTESDWSGSEHRSGLRSRAGIVNEPSRRDQSEGQSDWPKQRPLDRMNKSDANRALLIALGLMVELRI
jgi:hypothetical protein